MLADLLDGSVLLFVEVNLVLLEQVVAIGVDGNDQRTKLLDLAAPERFGHTQLVPVMLDNALYLGCGDNGAAGGEHAVDGAELLAGALGVGTHTALAHDDADTGVLQFWVKCGVNFPLMGELEALLKEAVVRATFAAPLRHNSVETFDEVNTKRNVGKGTPTVFWDIVPDDDHCEIYTYMAGGGCTLPGKAMVLMPGMGYEGVTKFVLDQMTSYGLNACPPLLVGVGVATSVETAALLSKKALMRPLGSHNPNPRAAEMEKLLEDGINSIGLGPQGMSGKNSVMGVHIENTARHPSTIGVAVNVGCWSHRRGHVVFDKDLNATVTTHSGVQL